MSTENSDSCKSSDSIEAIINRLNPDELESLRRKLNKSFLAKHLQKLFESVSNDLDGSTKSGVLGMKLAVFTQYVIDRLITGEVDKELRLVLKEFGSVLLQAVSALPDLEKQTNQTKVELEDAYEDLQTNLIALRQSVAMAIATEKQLEETVRKHEAQEITWQVRKDNALKIGDEDLAAAAEIQRSHFETTAKVLEAEYKNQMQKSAKLKELMAQMEEKVQDAYTSKQLAIAKERSANAALAAEETLSRFDFQRIEAALDAMERQVLEKEQLVALESQSPTVQSTQPSVTDVFDRTIRSVEKLCTLVERLERTIKSVEPSE
jgi:phage shock protein A